MANNDAFYRKLESLPDEILDGALEGFKAAALAGFADIVNATPEDTGLLKASWIPTVGEPSTEKPELGPDKQAPAIRDVNLGAISLANPIYFVNNQEYAGEIENGSSRVKAPQGIIGPLTPVLKGYLRVLVSEKLP